MQYDVLIVGAGPAGLSAAIRLKQLSALSSSPLSVCVIEKGAEVGAHILSGNVLEPRALEELFPDWQARGAPLTTPVTEDRLLFLTSTRAIPLPTPPSLHNAGNYIISLGALCKWLAAQAEELGVEIYPGFAASEVLYTADGAVRGVATVDQGLDKRGNVKETFTRGVALIGKQTLLAEGVRGSCSERVMAKYDLRASCDPQTYGLGLKEVWQVPAEQHQPGLVLHTIGWPAPSDTWCGTFMYHLQEERKVLLGAVVGLDYPNPHLSPYHTFQQYKKHPAIRRYLDGGTCLSYGARCINEGGLQAIPKLSFPGGLLIGCSAGFLNVPKIKGSHTAMKSGMVAAEEVWKAVQAAGEVHGEEGGRGLEGVELLGYQRTMEGSWVYDELRAVRNVHPAFNKLGGLYPWMAYAALQSYVLRGKEPWTFANHTADHERTLPLSASPPPLTYPAPDGRLTFDLLTNLARANVHHEEDQPSHLRIRPGMERNPVDVSLRRYGGPEQRFCPAKVYEYVGEGDAVRLQINASNCVHCKSCAIKTPQLYIDWNVPEGGGGPN